MVERGGLVLLLARACLLARDDDDPRLALLAVERLGLVSLEHLD